MLHFYNDEIYTSYDDAKAAGAVHICDAPAYEEEVEKWGFYGGALCDAMQAVQAALKAVGQTGAVEAVLFDGDKIIKKWSDDQ